MPTTFSADPIIKYGRMYIGDDSTSFYAFDYDNGRILWRYKTGYPILSTAAAADGHVVFGCTNGTLYCLSVETGKRQWTYKTGRTITQQVQIRKGKVIFHDDSTRYVLQLMTGKPVKRIAEGDTLLPMPINSVYTTDAGIITAHNATADSIRWQYRVSEQPLKQLVVSEEDEVLFVSTDGILGALHRVEPIIPDSIPADPTQLSTDTIAPLQAPARTDTIPSDN